MLRFWWVGLFLITSFSAYAMPSIEEDDVSSSSSISSNSMTGDQRIEKLERQMRNQSNLLKQIEITQQQVKDLQGQLEVVVHDIKILKEQQKNQYSDLDQRLSDLSHQKETPAATSTSKQEDNITEHSTKTAAINNVDEENKAGKAYQAAYVLLKNKNYSKAKNALQKFIHNYPKDSNVIDAYYWLGNIHLLENQPGKAMAQFKAVLKTNVPNTRTADAVFKLGLAYLMQGDSKQASMQFKKVKQNYPNTQAAKLASEQLKNLVS